MYDKHLSPEDRVAIIDSHLRRLAGDAYSNFCISRGLAAQGHTEQAAQHVEQMESLNDAIGALELERNVVTAGTEEVGHDHPHE